MTEEEENYEEDPEEEEAWAVGAVHLTDRRRHQRSGFLIKLGEAELDLLN